MASGRAGDPPNIDPSALRREVEITMREDELEAAFSTVIATATIRGVIAGALAAVITAALMGLYVADRVTRTVRHEVGHAALVNCAHTRTAAGALRKFLTTDAGFNAALGELDRRSASIDRDLSAQVAQLGRALPARIARDYQAQSDVFQQLALKRAQVADLWAGKRTRRGRARSLAGRLVTIIQARCDQLLVP